MILAVFLLPRSVSRLFHEKNKITLDKLLAIYTYYIILSNNLIRCENFRVVPDTDLARYPAAEMPANNFAGYQISG